MIEKNNAPLSLKMLKWAELIGLIHSNLINEVMWTNNFNDSFKKITFSRIHQNSLNLGGVG